MDLDESRLSGRFAVVVPDCDASSLMPLVEALGVSTFTCGQLLNEHVIQRADDGTVVSVLEPALFIGALATSKEGARTLDGAQSELELFFGQAAYEGLDLSGMAGGDQEATALRWVASRLSLVGSGLMVDVARVRQSLATLRQDHEEALERFAEIESATSHLSIPRLVSKLTYPASQARVRLQTGQGTIRQILSTSASGLSSLEIYQDGTGQEGEIEILLFLGASSVAAYQWNVPTARLRSGWVRVSVDRALTSHEQDATVQVRWNGAEQSKLPLALSYPNPMTEFCAELDNGTRLHAPLALRAWGMAPGSTVMAFSVAYVAQAGEGSPKRKAVRPAQSALGSNELRDVTLLSPSDLSLGWDIVAFREDQLDILVHPIEGGSTIAIVRNVDVYEVASVSALALIEKKESNPIDFGLALVAQEATYPHPEALIQRWTRVEPLLYTEIQGTVDIKPGAPVDLILATRMADGRPADFARALFKRVELKA